MAVRLKTKWHRSKRERKHIGESKPKTLEDSAGVIAFNIWKVAQEPFRNMEKEGFRFAEDKQVIDTITEFVAFLLHIVDRITYGQIEEAERAPLINAIAEHLADTIESNQIDLLGPGAYKAAFKKILNDRFETYSECTYSTTDGPSYEFKRYLAQKVSEIMSATDDKWVLEQVIDIEAPNAVERVTRIVNDVLGLRV